MQHPFPLHARKGPKRALPSPGLTTSKIQPLQRQILLDCIYLHFILMKKLDLYVRYERRKSFKTHVGSNTLLIVNQTNRMKAKASKEATLGGGDAKWGLVCICARWEMPNCLCFHLGNESSWAWLLSRTRLQTAGWGLQQCVTASQNLAEHFGITHLANAPLGRQALVLRGSKCLGVYWFSWIIHHTLCFPAKAVKTGTILCAFLAGHIWLLAAQEDQTGSCSHTSMRTHLPLYS